jgi:hypothetical protein
MKVLVTLTLLMLLLLLLFLWMKLRIIKWIFVQFPAGATGGGDGFRRNGFISGICWATDHHHHHLLHVLLLVSLYVVCFSLKTFAFSFAASFSFPFSNGDFPCQESNRSRPI